MIERLAVLALIFVLAFFTAACDRRQYAEDDPESWSAHELHSYRVNNRLPPPAPSYQAPEPALGWPYTWK